MIKVRLVDGSCVEYTTARFALSTDHGWELYTNKDKQTWVATVSAAHMVALESHDCEGIFQSITELITPIEKLDWLAENMRPLALLYPQNISDLKSKLAQWNAKTNQWKE